MAAKKVVTKKPAKKKVSASSEKTARAPETKIDQGANTQAIISGDASNGRPKIHAKTISIHLSVGTYDRDRTMEEFVEEVTKKLGIVSYKEEGLHGTVTGSYYILDGKVCLPEDYDQKKQNFLPGKTPPQWAGGPKPTPVSGGTNQEQMQRDAKELSRDEYDKKYKIGKYAHHGTPGSVLITPEMQKAKLEAHRKNKAKLEEEELEEFGWDESDVGDDDKLGKIADESASAFTKKLKAKKVVKKKPAPKKTTPKRVVKRGKK